MNDLCTAIREEVTELLLLDLEVDRARRPGPARVEQKLVPGQGDILLVVCDPVQPNVFYRRGPAMDT